MPKSIAVETGLLELIISLQSQPYLDGFFLVGGTALALHLNHRKSVDIDLFSNFPFDAVQLLEQLQQDYPYQLFYSGANTLKGSVSNINLDLIAHRYKLIGPIAAINGVKLLSLPDLIAMKLNAISVSGQRSKDFIDIFYLLDRFSLKDMLSFYMTKYDQKHSSFILKSLVFFEDVDIADWPVIINHPTLSWKEVMKRLIKETMNYSHEMR